MKLLRTISIALLLLLLPQALLGASRYEDKPDGWFAAGVIGTAGPVSSFDILSGNSFALTKNFGQNLYKTLYERIRSEGSEVAIEKTASRRSLSREEIFQLIPGSNITQLLTNPDPTKNLTPAEVEVQRKKLLEEIAEDKEFADLEVLIQSEVEPTEIFANGTESDSGFDLIADLEVIEAILFGDLETNLGNSGPGVPAGARDVTPDNATASSNESEQARQQRSPLARARQERVEEERAARQEVSALVASARVPQPLGSDAICAIDDDFNKEVERAIAKQEADSANSSVAQPPDEDSRDVPRQSGPEQAVGDDSSSNDDEKSEPQPAANWKRSTLCGKLFCLEIIPKFKKESSYIVTDSCIACHVEKINDAFNKTLGYSLIPSKVTGQVFEGPKCTKGAFKNFFNFTNFNMVFVPQPILTPPNDDIVVKGDLARSIIDFYERYFDNPGRCKKGEAGGACKPDKSAQQKAAQSVLNRAPAQSDPTEILSAIRREATVRTQAAKSLLDDTRTQSEAAALATQYSVLMRELETMNGYFESFKKLFLQIGDPSQGEAPCRLLQSKETCS